MRIAQINTTCGVGSTGRIAADIAALAAKRGDTCTVLFGIGAPSLDSVGVAFSVGSKNGARVHQRLGRLLDAQGEFSRAATRRLIAQLRAFQPNVVHLHNLHGSYLNVPMLMRYLKNWGGPVVWTFHDCWPFTGHCAFFDHAGCDKWRTGCFDCPQTRAYPGGWLIDGSRRNFARKRELFTALPDLTIVTPSKWLASLVKESFFAETPVRVLPNGVDRAAFRPHKSEIKTRHGLAKRSVALAVASDWDERKGLRYLIEVAESGLLPPDARVVAVGLSHEQIAGLPNSVLGRPRTKGAAELADWYAAADVLLDPTLEDNLPLVVLESLASGTPVVVFNTGGCGECVNASCGAVTPRGDAHALGTAAAAILSEKDDARARRRKAARDKSALFDRADCYAAYLSLYDELATHATRGRPEDRGKRR